jgi:hypothetical protein
MFLDSNAVAFLILNILCFMIYLNSEKIIKIHFIVYAYYTLLLALTFSRAAIAGFGITVLFSFIKRNVYRIVFLFLLLLFVSPIIVRYALSDDSFNSKIFIYRNTLTYLDQIDMPHLLFGNGFGNSERILGIYGHNYITLTLIEFGFIGLVIFFSIFISFLYSNKQTMFLLLPFFVTGLSYYPYSCAYFYTLLGIILVLEEGRTTLCKYNGIEN